MARHYRKEYQKGNVSPFLYVVGAALVVFLVGGWLAGLTDGMAVGTGPSERGEYLFFEDFGTVGSSQATFSEHPYGDIAVGITTGQRTVHTLDNVWIKKGLTTDTSHTITFEANDPETGQLSFTVLRSNLYGALQVVVNGETVFDSKAGSAASPDITLNNLRDGKNTITITAASSGARFWSPTVYRLANLELTVTDFGEKHFSRTFRLRPYELEGFDRGEFTFFIDSAQRADPLKVSINNNTIYQQRPVRRPSPYKATFSAREADLTVGENTIDVFTEKGSEYTLENALLQIYYFGQPNKTVFHREMTIRSNDYNTLQQEDVQGKISFDATVSLPGDMHITLGNTTFDIIPKTGQNQLFFDHTAVHRGTNMFSVATDATMELNNFSIAIADKR